MLTLQQQHEAFVERNRVEQLELMSQQHYVALPADPSPEPIADPTLAGQPAERSGKVLLWLALPGQA